MLLTLFKSGEICRTVLPEKVSGRYCVDHTTVSGDSETLIIVEAIENNWVLKCGANADFILSEGIKLKESAIGSGQRIDVAITRTGEKAVIMAEDIVAETMCFRKIVVSSSCRFRIGNQNDCDIFLNGVSGVNGSVTIDYNDKTGFTVAEFSGNELYINKGPISYTKIGLGDMISVSNHRFVFGKGFIAYDKEGSVETEKQNYFYKIHAS